MSTSPSIHHLDSDPIVVRALRALLSPWARDVAERLGPDLFPPGAPRFLATSLMVDPAPDDSDLWERQRREVAALLDHVEKCPDPADEQATVGHVIALSEWQHAPILAGQLRWAAAETESGTPVRWLRSRVQHAFDIAEGILPFDSTATWGERAA